MNRKLKLLVDALRSGKYEQGFHRLESSDGKFCLFGVACMVAEDHGCEVIVDKNDRLFGDGIYAQPYVLQWYKFTSYIIRLPDNCGGTRYRLEILNDSGFTFPQLADLIEYFHKDLIL